MRFFLFCLVQLLISVAAAIMAILGAMLLFGGCTSTPLPERAPAPRGYLSEQSRIEYEASVRVLVQCADLSSRTGSGVAVTARHLLTARHVVECPAPGPYQILARLAGGASIPVLVERLAEGEDAALLVAEGMAAPFAGAVGVLELDAPRVGERVCVVAGGSPSTQNLRECGYVAGTWQTLIAVAARVVPGNSGSAVWSARGRILGIVTGGEWHEGREHYGVVLRSRVLAGMVPSE